MLVPFVKTCAHNNSLHDGLQMQLYFGKLEACVQIEMNEPESKQKAIDWFSFQAIVF